MIIIINDKTFQKKKESQYDFLFFLLNLCFYKFFIAVFTDVKVELFIIPFNYTFV